MKKQNGMTKSICMIFMLLVFCLAPAFGGACGDVDTNGYVDIVDALLIAQHYVGLNPVNFDSTVADVNGDGSIDIVDALLVAQYYVGLIGSLTGCPATTPGPEPVTVFAVNCGGAAYTGSDGTEYEADRGYSGGTAYNNGASVSGTSDPTLYQTERYGNSTYSVAVPNGEYLVTLHFAENYHTQAGSRIFDVFIEGTESISNLDIYAAAGSNTAYLSENQVTVSDGEINIEFVTITENAMVNAIKVTLLSYSGDPVADFSISPSNPGPGDTVTVDASASFDPDGTITSYQVNYGDGYTANGAVTTHQYPVEGDYTITLTVTDNDGKSDTLAKNIFIGNEPPDKSYDIAGPSGETLRITAYGHYMIRVQVKRQGESFYPNNRYDIVANHDWNQGLSIDDSGSSVTLSTIAPGGVTVTVTKNPLRISYSTRNRTDALMTDRNGVSWSGNTVTADFTYASGEHFAGLGHTTYGRLNKLDRRGTSLRVTSGGEGALIVPFYMSSRGYGVFLNTTFTHTISLGANNTYSLSIDGEGYGGQMDYFFIAGPELTQVLDRYTQLTGRPRLPQRSIFGLHLSDKSDPQNDGESWWKSMINNHRNAGFAFDHQVNDNAWRMSNEQYSGQKNSWFDWRPDQFPDPAEYKRWCDQNGVTVTLDLNRPGIHLNPSWRDEYDIHGNTSYGPCPDFTNPAARQWIWDLFYDHAFNPALGYPGDAIWLDEFDYPDHSHSTTLYSGKRWAEESINYHLNLQKSCVKEGWDMVIGDAKRPYFWSRGATAGAQRWSTYWSGDLDSNWSDMTYQVRAMQSAGLSGFPYFNHDAGGHFNLSVNDDNIYRQWDMAFGSFTPIWKPHGPGHKRWPLQRNSTCQNTARVYITTRYEMVPYIYSYARIAQATGIPMARPMFLEDQNNLTAWDKDLQYMWGREMLVAPNCSDGNNNVSVWLPAGNWYDFWDDIKYSGNSTVNIYAATGDIPVLVKEGAVIPMAPYANSTFFIPKDELLVHVYSGADGSFRLYEDDGVTERFRTNNESRLTVMQFTQQDLGVEIGASQGSYSGAPASRSYQIIYHGLSAAQSLYLNNTPISTYSSAAAIPANQNGAVWDSQNKLLNIYVASRGVNTAFRVSTTAGTP